MFQRERAHNLLLLVEIHDGLLDAGSATRDEEVDNRVDVLLERLARRGANVGEDDSLASTFRNVLIEGFVSELN